MIFPELTIHKSCAFRHKNGDYEFFEGTEKFMTPDLCGYRQTCTSEGKLRVVQCPHGKLWDHVKDKCVPTAELPECEPTDNWVKQTNVDLVDCLGMIDGRCEIGFTEFDRAKKYCEHTEACAGIKLTNCNQVGIGFECFGSFWRPYSFIIETKNNTEVFIYQRSASDFDETDNDDENEVIKSLNFNYAEEAYLYYSGCADGFYNDDNSCSMTFESQLEGLKHCDTLKKCEGLAEQNGRYITVEKVSESPLHFSVRRNSDTRGQVIKKLNKIIKYLMDKGTANTMLVEPWTSDFSGELVDCTHKENGECGPKFADMFEAQYFCESQGDNCVGVTKVNNDYLTMSNISKKGTNSTVSSVKSMWCSSSTPPFSVALPSVFNKGNIVRIMWPVVNLRDAFILMGKSDDQMLARTWNNDPLRKTDYDRYALKITIMADTVILDKDFTVYNVRELKIIARKMIIKKRTILSFRQVNVISTWEPVKTAADPEIGTCPNKDKEFCHGIDGKRGDDGFPGTHITLDIGCINGDEGGAVFEITSGSASDGQHGSDGLDGQHGFEEPDSKNMWPRKVEGGVFSKCTSVCYGLSESQWRQKGKSCSYGGSRGGNGGRGGDSGRPGLPGKITLKTAKGFNQHLVSRLGKEGVPGRGGKRGLGGRQGKGGCGEYCKCSRVGNGRRLKTSCNSYSDCGSLRGDDCDVNINGNTGGTGNILTQTNKPVIDQTIDTKHIISADTVQQDFLLKYAVMLMNEETIDESQEVLNFLTKFQSITSRTANKLLSVLNKNGKIQTESRKKPKTTFINLQKSLQRRVTRGKRLEKALNSIGEVFDFTYMFYELADTVIQITEEELVDIQVEKHEATNKVGNTYGSLIKIDKSIDFTAKCINDDIELLTHRINQQIQSLEKYAKRQKRFSCFGGVMSLIPGLGGGVRGAAAKTTEAYFWSEIESKLSEMECEELTILNFMNEFIYKFSQLGEDVSLLRTPDDFKNFEPNGLKEFFAGDLFDSLKGEDFYIDFTCMLGLVEVDNSPPDMGLKPSLGDFFPMAEMSKKLADVTALSISIKALIDCLNSDNVGICIVNNCEKIMPGINVVLGEAGGFDCQYMNWSQLDEWVAAISEFKEELLKGLSSVLESLNGLNLVLVAVGDFVSDITNFLDTIYDLLSLDIFVDMTFENFGEFLLAILDNLDEIASKLPDFNLAEFYEKSKEIKDFLNNPDFEKWSEIISTTIHCKKQIDMFDECFNEIRTIDLKTVIKNDFSDFDAIRQEVDKVTCVEKLSLSACIDVKTLIVDNPSFGNLNKLQGLFDKFKMTLFDIHERFHNRIDYLEDLYESKPVICKQSRQLRGMVDVTKLIELKLPSLRKQLLTNTRGLLPEIPDYTEDIRRLSNQIMQNFKVNTVAAIDKMNFVVNPMLQEQIVLLKVQVRENFFQSVQNRFKKGLDSVNGRLEDQVELFQDVYQLYTFVQSQVFDDFIVLNDRFEHETLWRYPLHENLKTIIGESDTIVETGKLDAFTNYEVLSDEFLKEYNKYVTNVDKRGVIDKTLAASDATMENFYLNGGVQIDLNPADHDCMNCFNARLLSIKITDSWRSLDEKQLSFDVTHLGVEVQLKIENGFRAYDTIKNMPESFNATLGHAIENFKDRSPFANYFVELSSGAYADCDNLSDIQEQECRYRIRKSIKQLVFDFVIEFIPNYPDQIKECF